MKRRTVCFIALLVVFGLLLMGRSYEPVKAFAGNIMSRESFLAMTPYGVSEAHDTSTTLRKSPAIYWGGDVDGSITFADGTYQYAFNVSCDPIVAFTPRINEDTSNKLYAVHIKTLTSVGCTYEVRLSSNGTVTDVTSTIPVGWVAHGWR